VRRTLATNVLDDNLRNRQLLKFEILFEVGWVVLPPIEMTPIV